MQLVLRKKKFWLMPTFGKVTWREGASSLRRRRNDDIKNGRFNRVISVVGLSGS
jgi:hypothetical protein